MDKNIKDLWTTLHTHARNEMQNQNASLWLDTCEPISLEKNVLVLDTGNLFVKEQIQKNLLPELEELARSLGIAEKISLQVTMSVRSTEEQTRAEQLTRPSYSMKTGLNQSYEFETFVVGKSNRLAHASSLAVAQNPGSAYNPLFIWGGVGLGKTHLMHAIGHYVLENAPQAKVAYVSSEKFTNELISAIQNNRTQDFKNKYRTMDLLLIDDIQFLANKESTQEEFFHTFNSLYDAKKQIVISSDRPPKEIQSIEERLVSRFEWGLVMDIQPPDLETRIAILKKKAELRNFVVPDEVIYFLAQNIPSNIRELEGALNRTMACSQLSSEEITTENVANWLKDTIRTISKDPVSIERIQELVSEAFKIKLDDLIGNKRTADIALARQAAMYLAREMTDASLQQIGRAFKKKDHTTVLHACRRIEELTKNDIRVHKLVDTIRNKL